MLLIIDERLPLSIELIIFIFSQNDSELPRYDSLLS